MGGEIRAEQVSTLLFHSKFIIQNSKLLFSDGSALLIKAQANKVGKKSPRAAEADRGCGLWPQSE